MVAAAEVGRPRWSRPRFEVSYITGFGCSVLAVAGQIADYDHHQTPDHYGANFRATYRFLPLPVSAVDYVDRADVI